MKQEKIDRINALARKAKAEGLTEEETQERAALREEYRRDIRASLKAQLDRVYILEPDGTQTKLIKNDAKGEPNAEKDAKK